MKTTMNTKWIAIAVVLAAMLMGSFSDARAKEGSSEAKMKKKDAARATGDPKTDVAMRVRRYAAIYRLSEADQAKLEHILLAQQKDLADYEKVHGAKIKAVNEQIKVLQDQIAVLEKSKDVHRNVRKELALDHQAELNKAITNEQKVAYLAVYLKGYDTNSYLEYLPKEIQASLTQKCQAAAIELVAAGTDQSRDALKDATRKLQASFAAVVTPEIRKAAELRQMQDYALRSFARCELTDDQKTSIGELCAKSIKDRAATASRYAQIRKDYAAAKQVMAKGKSSSLYTIREEIAEKILTEEQRKRAPVKRKPSSRRDKPSTKKDKSSAKKGAKKSTL